jgi:hypothetical protein
MMPSVGKIKTLKNRAGAPAQRTVTLLSLILR